MTEEAYSVLFKTRVLNEAEKAGLDPETMEELKKTNPFQWLGCGNAKISPKEGLEDWMRQYKNK